MFPALLLLPLPTLAWRLLVLPPLAVLVFRVLMPFRFCCCSLSFSSLPFLLAFFDSASALLFMDFRAGGINFFSNDGFPRHIQDHISSMATPITEIFLLNLVDTLYNCLRICQFVFNGQQRCKEKAFIQSKVVITNQSRFISKKKKKKIQKSISFFCLFIMLN